MKTESSVHDIVDLILKRGMSYAWALGTLESMLSKALFTFATDEQRRKFLEEEIAKLTQ